MKPEERRQRLEQLYAYATALVAAARVMDERRYILEPLLRDETVKAALSKRFVNTYGAHAYNHVVPLLGQDLVRDLARLFLDDDKKAGSLINLYRKASDASIHRALRNQFVSIPDKWHDNPAPIKGLSDEQSERVREKWRDRDREDFAQSFDEGWIAVGQAVEALQVDPAAKKIKTFRDKYHAHLEMNPLGSDPGPFDLKRLGLTFDELLNFIDRYIDAVFELSRILTGSVFDVDGFSALHRRYGADMWRILAGLETENG